MLTFDEALLSSMTDDEATRVIKRQMALAREERIAEAMDSFVKELPVSKVNERLNALVQEGCKLAHEKDEKRRAVAEQLKEAEARERADAENRRKTAEADTIASLDTWMTNLRQNSRVQKKLSYRPDPEV